MIINHNLSAMNAHRQGGINTTAQGKSIEKLSSGLRINRAGDDAAGLSISEKMRGQIRGLQQGSRNSQDGVSLIQTAEGTLNETHSILQRMRELAVQASNGTNEDDDRAKITKEFSQLQDEVTRIATDAEFNKKKLLDGSMGGGKLGVTTTAKIKASGFALQTSAANKSVSAALKAASAAILVKSASIKQASADTKMGTYNALMTDAATLTGSAKADKLSSASKVLASANISKASAALKSGSAAIKQASSDIKSVSAAAKLQKANVKLASAGTGVKFQVGANSGQEIALSIDDMRATALGINAGKININTQASAKNAITEIEKALTKVSDQRAVLGAVQNRLEHTISATDNSAENLQAAESRIRDVDMASEMMSYSKSKILSQAAQSMLAQANQAPNNVLQLLQ